jgi:hypothetical protein
LPNRRLREDKDVLAENGKEASGKDKPVTESNNDMADFLKSRRAKSGADESLTTRTGGAYIPPARLRLMQVYIACSL